MFVEEVAVVDGDEDGGESAFAEDAAGEVGELEADPKGGELPASAEVIGPGFVADDAGEA